MSISYIHAAKGVDGKLQGITVKLARGNLRGDVTWALYSVGWIRIYRVIIRW